MKNHIVFLVILFFISQIINAQNPIVPAGVYIADPSAHVWKDGKIYIYGSNDESVNYYCSWTHHVLSSSDLLHWDLTKDVFSSKGKNDQVPYNDELLFAPDVQYKDGTYYMYYCQPSGTEAEGVATSKSPLGPFVNGKKMDTKGISEIDPCVFMDDDGQAYYIWGQFSAKVAKLKPNMTELDLSTLKDSVITEKEHFFHEGGYMVKRNGIYYFIYAHMGRSNRPTCIGYATAKSPFGPFKYGGVIIDNANCDPSNWNNHGSIVEFKGKWYVFYHRATHNSNMMRKACVEPITFNADGSINEVEMTTQGAGGPLKATSTIEAEQACLLFGNTYIDLYEPGKEELTAIKNNDNAAYKYINFEAGVDSFVVRVAPGKMGGFLQVALDQPWHQSIGTINVPAAQGDKQWVTLSCPVKKIQGVHAVWLRFYGKDTDLFDVDWFKFTR
ncbi:MAG: family 43 glycosylhydrolase [Bacteroidales bacterium]